jgi:chromosome segregation ATPase
VQSAFEGGRMTGESQESELKRLKSECSALRAALDEQRAAVATRDSANATLKKELAQERAARLEERRLSDLARQSAEKMLRKVSSERDAALTQATDSQQKALAFQAALGKAEARVRALQQKLSNSTGWNVLLGIGGLGLLATHKK